MIPSQPRCWYLAKNKQVLGPFFFEQLRQMAMAEMVERDDMVLRRRPSEMAAGQHNRGFISASRPATMMIRIVDFSDEDVVSCITDSCVSRGRGFLAR